MKRQVFFLIAILLLAGACASLPLRPDAACPDNLVLLDGEELPGLLVEMGNGEVQYMLLNGEVKTYRAEQVVRIDLGRRIGDPNLNSLLDLQDNEIRQIIERSLKAPLRVDKPISTLLEEHRRRYNDDGTKTSVYRRLSRINTQAGLSSANNSMTYNSIYTKAQVDFGYAISPDGKISVLSAGAVRDSDLGDGRPDGSQRRSLQIAIPDAAVGGFIYHQFSYTYQPQPLMPFIFSQTFAYENPTGTIRVIIDVPQTASLNIVEQNFGDWIVKTEQEKNGRRTITYEAHKLPEILGEPYMPNWNTVAPYLYITEKRTWSEIAEEYRELMKPRMQSDPTVTEFAKKLTEGKGPYEAASALYFFVLREVRENQAYIWDRDPLPKSPAQTLADRRGNYVDRTILLLALFRSVGLDASFCLVAPWRNHHPFIQAPSPRQLDAPLLRIQLPEGETWAELDNNSRVFGQIDNSIAGSLFVDIDSGETGYLPLNDTQANRARFVYDIYIQSDGSARISEQHDFFGGFAIAPRQLRHLEDEDLLDSMTSAVRRFAPRTSLVDFSYDGIHELSDPVSLRRTSQTPMFMLSSGGRYYLLRLFNLPRGEVSRVHETRIYPLERDDLSQIVNVYRFHLPPKIKVRQLPPPTQVETAWSSYRSSWSLDGDLLQFEDETVITAREMAADQFPAFEQFLRAQRDAAEAMLLLERSDR